MEYSRHIMGFYAHENVVKTRVVEWPKKEKIEEVGCPTCNSIR